MLFKTPFTCLISGPTGSGKSELLFNILKNINKYFDESPTKIIYCYGAFQEKFKEFPYIQFNHGLIDTDDLNSNEKNLIIIDDLMDDALNDKEISHLFTRGSHHKNISVFLLTQNFFSTGKYSRTISLNSNYLIIFNNPRDKLQISYLARQMYPSNSQFLIQTYENATNKPHGYLFIDNKQDTNPDLRIQSDILKDTYCLKKD